jgi:hypothetical protein
MADEQIQGHCRLYAQNRRATTGARVPFRMGSPLEALVIPAKTGVQFVESEPPKVWAVDSRSHGNDCGLQR